MTSNSDKSRPSPEAIRQALERVVSSKSFQASERKRDFLRFVVEETLSGRADRIKAYAIAIDVFRRDESFDPLTDPLIRIEAGRLRRCLERHYLTEGAEDPIRIAIPKGGYVPEFTFVAGKAPKSPEEGQAAAGENDDAMPPAPHPAAPWRTWRSFLKWTAVSGTTVLALVMVTWYAALLLPTEIRSAPLSPGFDASARGMSILVLPFANATGDPARDHLAAGFTEEIIAGLTAFQDLTVFGADAAIGKNREPGKIDYVLKGGIRQAGDQIRITTALIDPDDNRYLWTVSFDRTLSPGNILAVQGDIAERIVGALVGPIGVRCDETLRIANSKAPIEPVSDRCDGRFQTPPSARDPPGAVLDPADGERGGAGLPSRSVVDLHVPAGPPIGFKAAQ